MMNYKFLIDENIEHADYFFAEFGTLQRQAGRKITADDVKQHDVLLVRSVTKVNAHLLAESPIQFVGSATIGTDHLDIDDLQQRGITWTNAQGCNAQAVAEYVITALATVQPQCLDQAWTLGIIGLGNVGTRLAHLAQRLGWQVKGYDPFVQRETIEQVSLAEVLQCQAVSIHVPLTKTGAYPTYHLFDEQTLAQLNPKAILINSARGEVIKEQALLADIAQTGRTVILDVFEHEPSISQAVLDAVKIVTPHIAGYSLEGKIRGTEMLYQAFCQYTQQTITKNMMSLLPECPALFQPDVSLNENLKHHLSQLYPILQDDQRLRSCVKNGVIDGNAFDQLRKNYPLRREWSAFGDKG